MIHRQTLRTKWQAALTAQCQEMAEVRHHRLLYTVCRYEVLYNHMSINRLLEFIQLGWLDHRKLITMKVSLPFTRADAHMCVCVCVCVCVCLHCPV